MCYTHSSFALTSNNKTSKTKVSKTYQKKVIKKNKSIIKQSNKQQQKLNQCKNDANCLKLKGNKANVNTLTTKSSKKAKLTRKQKKNIQKITKIEFLDDSAIIALIDEQQNMVITPKEILVRTKDKGVPRICLANTPLTTKEKKKTDKDLQNAKDNLKQHIRQSLITNEVSEELIDYLDQHLMYQKPTKKKNQTIITRKMIDFINRCNVDVRITNGKIYKKMYQQTLEEVENLFFVDAEAILAIWAMETQYGAFIGNSDAFNALYSACLNSQTINRLRYFEDNIISLAILVDRGYFPRDVVSSFDGGLGGCQFMPDSFYKFAVSLDGGKTDIINKNEDVLASIGNYLHSMGWRYKEGILTEVELPENIDKCIVGMNTIKTIEEWKKLGIKVNKNGIGREYFDNNTANASLIITDPNDSDKETPNKRAFLVYDNYKVILGYNQQLAYGITAGIISEGLRDNA